MRDTAAVGLLAGFENMLPAYARRGSIHRGDGGPIELTIDKHTLDIGGRRGSAIAVNGTVPGPLVRLREGQEAVIRVTNRMKGRGRLNPLARCGWTRPTLPTSPATTSPS